MDGGRRDKYELLCDLIVAGANLDDRAMNGWTALHLAAVCNDLQAVEMLLAAGADPDARTTIDWYSTPLEDAERYGSQEAARMIRDDHGQTT